MCIKWILTWLSTFGKSPKTPANVSAATVTQSVVQPDHSGAASNTGNVDTETLLGRLPELPHVATAMGTILRSLRIRR